MRLVEWVKGIIARIKLWFEMTKFIKEIVPELGDEFYLRHGRVPDDDEIEDLCNQSFRMWKDHLRLKEYKENKNHEFKAN